jgi:hypothetical protein
MAYVLVMTQRVPVADAAVETESDRLRRFAWEAEGVTRARASVAATRHRLK